MDVNSRLVVALFTTWLAAVPLSEDAFAQTGKFDDAGVSDTLSLLHPARAKTFVRSSSDPDERPTAALRGNDDGFTGLNGVEAFRESVQGVEHAVLCDIAGRSGYMGCFFRNFWSGLVGQPIQMNEINRTQIWLDGVVAHDLPLESFFRSPGGPLPQVAPFQGFFTQGRAGGHLTHTPLTWQDKFQVRVFENSFQNEARFHKVCGSLASPEQLLRVPDLSAWETVAAAAGNWPHRSPRVTFSRRATLAADGGVQCIDLEGPTTVLELTCRVGQLSDFENLWARFTWDDLPTPSVQVPLRFLGGMMQPPFSQPFNSVLFNNNGVDTVTCYLPMHVAEYGRLEFVNQGATPIQLDTTFAFAYGEHPQPWGHFVADYTRGITQTGVTFEGTRRTDERGMLRGIMLESSINTSGEIPPPINLEHLEGDLCVRINGNRGDDHIFAASETSIGKWGWYGTPSDVQFATDTSFNTGVQARMRPDGAVESMRMMGSTFVFDPIHYVNGIDVRLEHGVQNESNAIYGLMTFGYVQAGAAREQVAEIDVEDAASEAASSVVFGSAPPFTLSSNFFRDPFFGTAPLSDDGRQIDDYYRFTVTVPAGQTYRGFCVALRLDRERIGAGGIAQADVFVDGMPAGLLHSYTSNALNQWKEGGELEVELPRALTDGLSQFVVELRPRATTLPVRIGNIKVFGYTAD